LSYPAALHDIYSYVYAETAIKHQSTNHQPTRSVWLLLLKILNLFIYQSPKVLWKTFWGPGLTC